MITAVGLGDSQPIRHGSAAYQLEVNRSVSLKVQSQPQGEQCQMIQKKICMLGSFGVGKTSLVARFVQGIFSAKYLSTVGVKIDKKRNQGWGAGRAADGVGPGWRGLTLAGANFLSARSGGIFPDMRWYLGRIAGHRQEHSQTSGRGGGRDSVRARCEQDPIFGTSGRSPLRSWKNWTPKAGRSRSPAPRAEMAWKKCSPMLTEEILRHQPMSDAAGEG